MTVYQLNQMPRFAKMLKEFRRSRTDFKITTLPCNALLCLCNKNLRQNLQLHGKLTFHGSREESEIVGSKSVGSLDHI